MYEEKIYFIAFNACPGVGPVRFEHLVKTFKTAKQAWYASYSDLNDSGLGRKLSEQIVKFRNSFDINSYLKKLNKLNIRVVIKKDSKYPKLLRQISDAPYVLYVRSAILNLNDLFDMPMISVVGTRKASDYGKMAVEKIVSGLVSYGVCVVSGMAYGIDTYAHKSAIHESGRTIAVLGCGVNIIAPTSGTDIYHKIINNNCGAVISEMPLSHKPAKGLFPARNRIISGLSKGTIVIEGSSTSGTLITASYAANQGREVFVVPGPITSIGSKASLILLKSGAIPIESASDVIEALGIKHTRISENNTDIEKNNLNNNQLKIIKCISDGNNHFNDIVKKTGLTVSEVAVNITHLEMNNIIKTAGSEMYEIL